MNGAHYDAQASLLQKLVEIANDICCKGAHTGLSAGKHDFEERFAPVVRDGILTALLNEQIFHGGGPNSEKRISNLLLELGKVRPIG
jgi:hypothetical protein